MFSHIFPPTLPNANSVTEGRDRPLLHSVSLRNRAWSPGVPARPSPNFFPLSEPVKRSVAPSCALSSGCSSHIPQRTLPLSHSAGNIKRDLSAE